MTLNKILSVSGKPGLYRYVAKARNGMIIEPLAGGGKLSIPMNSHVSTLADISIYTNGGEKPLHEVLDAACEHDQAIRALNIKKDTQQVQELFRQIVPDYQEHRVYLNDMQKVMRWYVLLRDAGIDSFAPETPTEGVDQS
ncbi:MAG: hypothetical protein CSA97_03435 [Bacteroidetes bacterium]|nr:MAG: hypothetical protein CSA97_03435 [Bacteroidota bacterium]